MILSKTLTYDERIQKSFTLLDNCKNLIVNFDKQIVNFKNDNKMWQVNTMEKIRKDLEEELRARAKNLDQNMMANNRFLSDIQKNQFEMETYIDKYMPYNFMVKVFSMLNETVQEPRLFNNFVDYQAKMKRSYYEELKEINSKLYSLNKRKVVEFEIPQKKKLIV